MKRNHPNHQEDVPAKVVNCLLAFAISSTLIICLLSIKLSALHAEAILANHNRLLAERDRNLAIQARNRTEQQCAEDERELQMLRLIQDGWSRSMQQ